MMPAIQGLCLQYAPVTLLALAACNLLLFRREAIDSAVSIPVYFAAVGLLTSYYDLLTYPTVTLAFPLVFEIALRRQAGESAAKTFRIAALSAVAWGVGFAGMWAFKWGLNLLVFPISAGGIFSQIFLRISNRSHGKTYSRVEALWRNASLVFTKASSLSILALSGVGSVFAGLFGGRRKQPDPGCLAYLIPALLPVLWMLFTANHVWDHHYYTYRNLCGTIFAGMAMLSDYRGCLNAESANP